MNDWMSGMEQCCGTSEIALGGFRFRDQETDDKIKANV